MKDVILLMSANPYSIVDDRTGVVNEGISIAYCMTPDMLPHAEESGFQGYRVLKGSIPKGDMTKFVQTPGFYEAEFAVKPDSSGKAVLKPISLEYKRSVLGVKA